MTGPDDRWAPFGTRSPDAAGLRSAARSGTRWSVAQQAGGRLAAVAAFLVLARLVGPEGFGLAALALVFVALAQILVEGGFGQALIQRDDLRPGHADTAFWANLVGSVVLTAALAVAAGPLAALLGEPALAPVLRVTSLAVVLGALGATQVALLRRRFAFRALAVRTTVADLTGGAAGVVAAVSGAGVWALVTQYLVAVGVGTALVWVASPWRPGTAVSRASFRDLFGFSRNSLGGALLATVNQRGDDLLVGALLGSVALGVYSVGYRLLTLLRTLIAQTINVVSLPVLSRLQDDPAGLGRMYRSALAVGVAVSAPVYSFFVVAAPDAVAVFFGPRWADAAPVMRVLALAGVAHTAIAVTEGCLTASGRPHLTFRIRLLWALLLISSLVLAVPHGIVWAAVAVVAAAWLVAPLPVWALRRAGITTVRRCAAAVAGPLVATAVMLALLVAVTAVSGTLPAPARLGLLAVAGAVGYLATLRLVDHDLLRRMGALAGIGPGR